MQRVEQFVGEGLRVHHRQVRAGAEHAALPGQHDGTRAVVGGVLDPVAQPVEHLLVERVSALGTLQFDGDDVAVSADPDHA